MKKLPLIKLAMAIVMVCVPAIVLSAESPIPKPELASVASANMSGNMIKVTVGLLFVVAAIFASAWLFRRFGNFSAVPGNALRIVGGLSLGNRERIVLLQVGEEQLLIGITAGQIRTLHKLEQPIDIEPKTAQVNENFAAKLNIALKQWKSGKE